MTQHAPVNWTSDETPGVECLTCGHVVPMPDGRCPRCKKPLTQLQPRALPAAPSPGALVLPNTRAARKLEAAAQELEAELAQREGALQTAVNQAAVELTTVKRALTAISSMRQQITIDGAAPAEGPAGAGTVTGKLLGARWTMKYAACRDCGRIDRPHKGRGYCVACHKHHPPSEDPQHG